MGRPAAERDPRRSLLIGGLLAAVVLAILFALVLIGVVKVVSARESPRSLGAATKSSAVAMAHRPFGRHLAV